MNPLSVDMLPAPWDEEVPAPSPQTAVPPLSASDLLNPSPPPEKAFNYIPYFTEIEKTFTAERGKPFWLSPTGWAQVEAWKSDGIPCEVACEGIRCAFATLRKRSGKSRSEGQIYGIGYCDPFVRELWEKVRKQQGKPVPPPAAIPSPPPPQPSLPLVETPPAAAGSDALRSSAAHSARLQSFANQLLLSRPPSPDWSPGDWDTLVREAAERLQGLAATLALEGSLAALVQTETRLMELEEALGNCLMEQAPSSLREALWESGRTLAARQGLPASMRRLWVEQYVRRKLWAEAGWPALTLVSPTG